MRSLVQLSGYLLMVTLLTSSFFGCRKKETANPVDAKKSIVGPWAMSGTYEYWSISSSGSGSGGKDTLTTTITIFQADDATIVMEKDDYYEVLVLHASSDSTLTFTQRSYEIVYNFVRNSLYYHYYYRNSSGSYNEYILYSNPGHIKGYKNVISDNTAKMTGTKDWHGTTQYTYYAGLPRGNVDTTFYTPFKMQINALADNLILGRVYYDNSNDVYDYLILKKTYDDPTMIIFDGVDKGGSFTTNITYYPADNRMSYLDSANYSHHVKKYYSP